MYAWDFAALKPYWGLIWQGLEVTVLYTVSTVIAGLAIGLVVGILRTTAPSWVSIPLRGYIEVFRCTPLLVQLVWVYYALPVLIGVDMSATTACFLTLSLYAGAFYAEIFRGGSIPAGKYSLLLRAQFQSAQRTLRDDEVAKWSEQIVRAMEGLGGTLRS